MGECRLCGAELEAEDRFCSVCGAPAPEAAEEAAGGEAEGQAVSGPDLVTGDWPLVGVVSLLFITGLVGAGMVYGAVLSGAATADVGSAFAGALAGVFLPFAALGGEVGVAATIGDSTVLFGTQFLPIGLTVLVAAWLRTVLRYALARLPPDPTRRVVFLAKFVVAFSTGFGILAAVLSTGSHDDSRLSSDFSAEVAGDKAFFFTLVLLGLIGVVLLWMLDPDTRPGFLGRLDGLAGSSMSDGAVAFVGLAVVGLAVSVAGALAVADSVVDRVAFVLALPVIGVNLAVMCAVVMMGGSVAGENLRGADHLSLFNWGFPPGLDAEAAFPALFVLLLAAPAALYWSTQRRLRRQPPADEQTALRVGFGVAGGFTLTSLIAAVLAKTTVVVGASEWDRRFDAAVGLEPSVGAAFGLAVLWSALAAVGGAWTWARQRDLPWAESDPAP